ncbi:hypothetical protein BJ166DRAFT_537089 [Pestalotiopsis sp. NC0098]|nr:hypothetical protein BJ166DRAFT_537089 [Pestalotiopsis sp. NC0098]
MSSRNEPRRSSSNSCLPIRTRRSSSPADPVRRRESRQALPGQCNNPAHNHRPPHSHTPNHRHNRGHARRAPSPDQANSNERHRHYDHRRHPIHAIADLMRGGYIREDGYLDIPWVEIDGETHRFDGQPSSSSHHRRPHQERRLHSAGRSHRRNEPRVDVDLTEGHRPVEARSARRRHDLPHNAVDIMEDRWTVSYTLRRSSQDTNASASRSRRSRAPSPPSHRGEPQDGPVANQRITIVSPGPVGIMIGDGEYIPMPSARRYRFGPLQDDQPNGNNVARTVWQAIRQGDDQPSGSQMPSEITQGYLPGTEPVNPVSHHSSRQGEDQATSSEQDQSSQPQSPASPGGNRSISSSGQPSQPEPEADAPELIKEEQQSVLARGLRSIFPPGHNQSSRPQSSAPPGDNSSTAPPGQYPSSQDQSSQESSQSSRPRGSSISID